MKKEKPLKVGITRRPHGLFTRLLAGVDWPDDVVIQIEEEKYCMNYRQPEWILNRGNHAYSALSPDFVCFTNSIKEGVEMAKKDYIKQKKREIFYEKLYEYQRKESDFVNEEMAE
jgi:hypothetical protein